MKEHASTGDPTVSAESAMDPGELGRTKELVMESDTLEKLKAVQEFAVERLEQLREDHHNHRKREAELEESVTDLQNAQQALTEFMDTYAEDTLSNEEIHQVEQILVSINSRLEGARQKHSKASDIAGSCLEEIKVVIDWKACIEVVVKLVREETLTPELFEAQFLRSTGLTSVRPVPSLE